LPGRFREFNQIQPPNRIVECRTTASNGLEVVRLKALDLESSDGHFQASSWHQGPLRESTRLTLHQDDGIVVGRGLDHEHLFRAAILWIVSPRANLGEVLACR